MLEISTGYLSAISFGAIPMTIFQALRGYSEGITKTKVVFFLNLFAFLLNTEIMLAIKLAKMLTVFVKNKSIIFTVNLIGNSTKFANGFLCKFCGNK